VNRIDEGKTRSIYFETRNKQIQISLYSNIWSETYRVVKKMCKYKQDRKYMCKWFWSI